jgi:hypothetical protein
MKRPDSAKTRGERRVDTRKKVRKVGRIIVDEPRKIYSCIILDLSTTGALVLIHDKVPDQFGLFYAATRTLREVVVVRRLQDTLGVRFEGEPVVLLPDDPRLDDLR